MDISCEDSSKQFCENLSIHIIYIQKLACIRAGKKYDAFKWKYASYVRGSYIDIHIRKNAHATISKALLNHTKYHVQYSMACLYVLRITAVYQKHITVSALASGQYAHTSKAM